MKKIHPSLIFTGALVAGLGAAIAGSVLRDSVDRSGRPERLLQASLEPMTSDMDLQIPEGQYFLKLTDLVKREYVEPIGDDSKLAVGAVRGMVASLVDPWSQFMNPSQYAAFLQARKGEMNGIGAELALVYGPEAKKLGSAGLEAQEDDVGPNTDRAALLPELIVTAVAPGSQAEAAGLRPGDRIEAIDGRWVPSEAVVKAWREEQRKLQAEGNTAKLSELRQQIREKTRADRPATRARDILNENGLPVEVEWVRGTEQLKAKLDRKPFKVAPIVNGEESPQLRFFQGADLAFEKALKSGKTTFDLRNSFAGDADVMIRCLEKFLPPGEVGSIIDRRGGKPKPLNLKGHGENTKLTLIVDESTRGAAALFAQIAEAHGSKLIGKLNPDNAVFVAHYQLVDGSGYSIVYGQFAAPSAGGTK